MFTQSTFNLPKETVLNNAERLPKRCLSLVENRCWAQRVGCLGWRKRRVPALWPLPWQLGQHFLSRVGSQGRFLLGIRGWLCTPIPPRMLFGVAVHQDERGESCHEHGRRIW